MASIGISDVVTASVYSEKTRTKKLMMMMMKMIIIIIMNKSQELTVFHGRQKLTSALQIWCSIQLSLYKEPPEVGLVKKLTGSLY